MLELYNPNTNDGKRLVGKVWREVPCAKQQRPQRGVVVVEVVVVEAAAARLGRSVAVVVVVRLLQRRVPAGPSRAAAVKGKERRSRYAESEGSELEEEGSDALVGSSEGEDDDEEEVAQPELGMAVEVYVTEGGGGGGGGGAARGGKRKRPRGEWVQAEVVRLFRGGSFEVVIGGKGTKEEEGGKEEEEEAAPLLESATDKEGGPAAAAAGGGEAEMEGEDEEEEFEIEALLEEYKSPPYEEAGFKVRWVGWPKAGFEDTIEPEENLPEELVRAFRRGEGRKMKVSLDGFGKEWRHVRK